MRFGVVLGLIVASVMLAESSQTKSSFENGNFSGWNVQGEGWSIYARAGSDGKKSAMCTVSRGQAAGMAVCAQSVEKAEPGWMVKVDLDVAGKAKSKSSKVSIVVMCIDADGNTLDEVRKQITNPSATFQKVSLTEFMIPSGTAETYLMLIVEVEDKARGKEWWRFDNIVIQIK